MKMSNNDNPNVFIRGIYTTALTKMFLDAGYSILRPSEPIQKRFDIPYQTDKYSKDIEIREREDKQGISITIKRKVWNQLKEDKLHNFPLTLKKNSDLIQLPSNFNENDIYRGVVIKSSKRKNYCFVKLLPRYEEGISGKKIYESVDHRLQTNTGYYGSYIPKGKMRVFQVKNEDYGKRAADLTDGFTLPGGLLVIDPNKKSVNISRKIDDSHERNKLLKFGDELLEGKDFGIIFRTSAKFATEEEIRQEAHELEEELKTIREKISETWGDIGRIYSKFKTINLVFPYMIKQKLDTIRSKATPTLTNHHMIKSLPRKKKKTGKYDTNEQTLLDYTEDMLQVVDDSHKEKIQQFFLDTYYERIKEGKWMNINHFKFSGEKIDLKGGKIQQLSKHPNRPLKLCVKRYFSGGGAYDGLEMEIEKGDYALSYFQENKWYYLNEYYSSNDELKGQYVNINTPIEISNHCIQYIDLEIDVVVSKGGEREIIDADKLENAFRLKVISPDLYERALQLAITLKSSSK